MSPQSSDYEITSLFYLFSDAYSVGLACFALKKNHLVEEKSSIHFSTHGCDVGPGSFYLDLHSLIHVAPNIGPKTEAFI